MDRRNILIPTLLFILLPLFTQAQILVRGSVRDAYTRQLLSDVNIIGKSLQSGTSTNQKGKFAINIPESGQTKLHFSHIGYREMEYTLNAENLKDEMSILLTPEAIVIDPVTISATLNRRKVSKLPGRVAVLGKAEAEMIPANNTDDLLQGIANVNINRSWGIFSKGASVTMRGLPGSARTLVLIDGIPMNKVSGGTINWNFIQSGDIDKIEVVKGPGSALYGNNAMGGVINMTTNRPEKTLEGKIRAFGGSLGTYGGALQLGGSNKSNGKGFYWDGNAFYRTGDGYFIEPEETRDETDAKVGLDEYNLGLGAGYSLDSNNTVGLQYHYYNGTFGTGTQVFEDDGSWDQYRSHLLAGTYNGKRGEYKMQARVYYQLENFDRQNESVNRTGKYKLSDTESVKNDMGLWFNASRKFFNNHLLTGGIEFKTGNMDATEQYHTSSDRVDYGGKLYFGGIFLQDEYNISKKLSAIAGIRFDMASFINGFQDVTDPTSNTGFINDTSTSFTNETWLQFSPKIAIQYQFNPGLGAYLSVSRGFMPPKIDDLVKSGKISKGFKLANPELKPESLMNYETGITWVVSEKLSFEPSVYYSRGHEFQYFVATGDSVDTGGTDLKPVLQRRNVTEVEILGAEITARWEVFTNLYLTASYALNESEIIEFNDPYDDDKNLTGKSLIEVPEDKAYASISWRNKILNFYFDWMYTGKEWYDDENTQYIPPYHVFGLKLSKTLKQGIGFDLTIDNIFDNVTIDRKGKQTPGRFIVAGVFYEM